MKKCPKCGKKIVGDEKFCEECGTPLFFCPKCGANISEDDDFCESCGAKLKAEQAKEKEKKDVEISTVKPHNKGSKNTVIAVVAVLCIAVGGYFGYRQMVVVPREKAEIEAQVKLAERDKQAEKEKAKADAAKEAKDKKQNAGNDGGANKTPKKEVVNRGVIMDTDPNGLNVRSGPGTGYPIVRALAYGTVVEVKDANGNWLHINYGGTLGWASGNLIKIMDNVQRDGYINAADSNIRSGPSSDSHLLGVFATNEKVYVVGRINGWYNVTRSDGSSCWVHDGYVSF